jgi:endonuclease III
LKHSDATLPTYVRRQMKHLEYAYETFAAILDLLLKHLDKTLATYVRKQLKNLEHTSETLAKTYATSR